ncbi:very short patch repair endonuclease [soil metagenome]
MSAIRSRDNLTEVALRRALFALGLRYRLHPPNVLGKPDIVFPHARVAVFVDGDYWHARILKEKGRTALEERVAGNNSDYWITKFTKRVVRDDEVTSTLEYQGWKVLRYWESDIRKSIRETAADIAYVVAALKVEDTAGSD